MKVEDRLFVAIEYRLALDSGEEADRSPEGEPLGFVTGTGRIIPGLENALRGREQGESFSVTLEPEEGYGSVEKDLFQDIPRGRFPEGVEIRTGMAFQAMGPRGPVTMRVASVNEDDTVTMDLNHPMAGKRLHFDVRIVEVREPRPEDMAGLSGGCGCGPSGSGGCGTGGDSGCACG